MSKDTRTLTKNYRCESFEYREEFLRETLESCSRILKNFSEPEVIGQGSYGVVHKCLAIHINSGDVLKVAIKVSRIVDDHDFQEVEKTYMMSDQNIGPQLFETFFSIAPNGYITQFMIMQAMDMDCNTALQDLTISIEDKQMICHRMLHLIYLQFSIHDMICTDIKPTNFVYDKATKQVKMIDFGQCIFDYPSKVNENYTFIVFSILLLQLYFLTGLTLFHQVYVSSNGTGLGSLSYYECLKILNVYRHYKVPIPGQNREYVFFPREEQQITEICAILNHTSSFTDNLNNIFTHYIQKSRPEGVGSPYLNLPKYDRLDIIRVINFLPFNELQTKIFLPYHNHRKGVLQNKKNQILPNFSPIDRNAFNRDEAEEVD